MTREETKQQNNHNTKTKSEMTISPSEVQLMLLSKDHDNNIKIKSEIFGDIELRYVSIGDSIEFSKILQEPLNDRDFVVKILFYQIIKPKITFDNFQKLPDVELENLAKVFVKNEDYTFEYFQDTGDYFKDFRNALTVKLEELQKKFEPIIKSAQEKLTAFSKNYFSVIQQAIDGTSYIQESMEGLAQVAKQVDDTERLLESLESVIEQIQATAKIIDEIRSQFDFWQKWAEQNERVFENFINLAPDQSKKEFLLQNGWVFSPYLSNKSIQNELNSDDVLKKKNSEINTIYEKFFSENDYLELEGMINSWDKKDHFKKRMNIFKDCLIILRTFRPPKKRNKIINPARTILPLLIAQIDGITSEYAINKGLVLKKTQWVDSSNKTVKKFDSIWRQPCSNFSGISDIFTIRMLEDYLFSKAYPYSENNSIQISENPKKVKYRPFFQFSRHKIMHGEDLQFGTIDNVIRAFLLLDFLANLK